MIPYKHILSILIFSLITVSLLSQIPTIRTPQPATLPSGIVTGNPNNINTPSVPNIPNFPPLSCGTLL